MPVTVLLRIGAGMNSMNYWKLSNVLWIFTNPVSLEPLLPQPTCNFNPSLASTQWSPNAKFGMPSPVLTSDCYLGLQSSILHNQTTSWRGCQRPSVKKVHSLHPYNPHCSIKKLQCRYLHKAFLMPHFTIGVNNLFILSESIIAAGTDGHPTQRHVELGLKTRTHARHCT